MKYARLINQKAIVTALLYLFSSVIFLYSFIYYPISQGHSGDFLNRLRGGMSFDNKWVYWDGRGMDIYGPLFTLLDYLIHHSQLERIVFLRILFSFYLVLLFITSFLLLKIFQFWDACHVKKATGIFLIVNFFPLTQALKQDVIENLQLFSLVLFMVFLTLYQRRRHLFAGISLGLSICAKTIPAVLIPYLLARRYKKMVIIAMVFFLTMVGGVSYLKEITIWEGLKNIFPFDSAFSFSPHHGLDFHENQSIHGFTYRLFADIQYNNLSSVTHPSMPEQYRLTFEITRYLFLSLIILLVAWQVVPFFFKMRRLELPKLIYLEISILFALVLLALPHTEIYYFILTLPAYLLLFEMFFWKSSGFAPRRVCHWIRRGLLIFSYLLLGFRLPLKVLDYILPSSFACPYIQLTNLWNFPFYGLVILLVLLVNSYRQVGYSKEGGDYGNIHHKNTEIHRDTDKVNAKT